MAGLKTLAAVVIYWFGLNSFLVGLAYSTSPGYWLPLAVGVVLVLSSIVLLWSGVRQFKANIRRQTYRAGIDRF